MSIEHTFCRSCAGTDVHEHGCPESPTFGATEVRALPDYATPWSKATVTFARWFSQYRDRPAPRLTLVR